MQNDPYVLSDGTRITLYPMVCLRGKITLMLNASTFVDASFKAGLFSMKVFSMKVFNITLSHVFTKFANLFHTVFAFQFFPLYK